MHSHESIAPEAVRAVYVVVETGSFAADLLRLWNGTLLDDHPLAALRNHVGEAAAWGAQPHVTVLDALTTRRPDAFDNLVRTLCATATPLELQPGEVALLGMHSLVVGWPAQALENFRSALQLVSHPLICE